MRVDPALAETSPDVPLFLHDGRPYLLRVAELVGPRSVEYNPPEDRPPMFRKRMWIGLLLVGLVGTGGCGVQDSSQPAVGSISAGARRDEVGPGVPSGRAKAAVGRRH